jgi:hypothetical protein
VLREVDMKPIRIFRYLADLGCFVVSDEYQGIADHLGQSGVVKSATTMRTGKYGGRWKMPTKLAP